VFSPDGKVLASASYDRTVQFWETTTGKELRCLRGGQPELRAIALSADGKTLASAGWDAPIFLWDFATGKELRRVGTRLRVNALAFSPDGQKLASANEDQTVRVWQVATGKALLRLKGPKSDPRELMRFGIALEGGFRAVAFAQGGKTLLAHYWDQSVLLWDARTGKQRRRVGGGFRGMGSVAFAPGGKTLIAGDNNKPLNLWDLARSKIVRHLGGNHGNVYALAITADGKAIAAGSTVGQIHLWDAATGKQRWHFRGPRGAVSVLTFSPNGKMLAIGGLANAVLLLDTRTGKPVHHRAGHQGALHSVSFSPDGKTLATASEDHTLRLWRVATGAEMRRLGRGPDKGLAGCAFAPDGKLLASWSNHQWQEEEGLAALAAFAKDGVCAHIGFWDAVTGKERHRVASRQGYVYGVTFSPDSKTLAAHCSDNMIRVWDARTGKRLLRVQHPESVTSLVFAGDGKTLITGGSDLQIRFWDVKTGKEVRRFGGQPEAYLVCALSSDGKTLVTRGQQQGVLDGSNGGIAFWDVAGGKVRCTISGLQAPIYAVTLSPDDKTLAAGGVDKTIHLWELATGQERGRLAGHRSWVSCLAISFDSRLLASGSHDTTVLLWDLTGQKGDGQAKARLVSAWTLNRLWSALAGTDGVAAYRAIWTMAATPRETVALLKERLHPVPLADPRQVGRWIADLDSSRYALRKKAAQALAKLGDSAAAALRRRLEENPSLEVRKRVEKLLSQQAGRALGRDEMQTLRAVEVLEHAGTTEARALLRALTKGDPGARLTREARAALNRLLRQTSVKH
jgi:WD40 repeat protein